MDFLRIRMQVHHMKENPTPDVKISVYMTVRKLIKNTLYYFIIIFQNTKYV